MYRFLKLFGRLLALLPVTVIEKLGWLLAILFFDIMRLRRKVVVRNLTIAFGEEMSQEQRVRLGRRSIYHFILSIFEFFRSVRLKIDRDITVIGKENVDQALEKRKGVYILCFHMGNWEAMGAKYSNEIAPSPIIVKKVGTGGVSRFVDELRDKNNFQTVKRTKKGDGVRAIKEILGRNEMVGFVIDQARPASPKLPFFGKPAKTNTSFAAIWRQHPAPIVPSFILRNGLDSHVLHIMPELQIAVSDDAEEDVAKHSAYFNNVVEGIVRRCPEQYFWLHNRWK